VILTRCTQNVRYDKTILVGNWPTWRSGRGLGRIPAGCWVAARAWLRFAERLDELAAFAAGLHPPAGTDAVPAVSAAFGRTASDLMGHIEAV
jgi:hypothetical protein